MKRPSATKTDSVPKEEKSEVKSSHTSKVAKKIKYEFGGPVGSFFVVIGTPFVIYALFFLCNKDICLSNPLNFDTEQFKTLLPTSMNTLFSIEATLMYLGWLAFHVILGYVLPGESADGVVLEDGSKLKYTMSGHLQFWITLLVVGFGLPIITFSSSTGSPSTSLTDLVVTIQGFTSVPIDVIYDHYLQLISISVAFTALFSFYLYISSFLPRGKILAKGGNTGSAMYDYFIGRELNPRIGSLDLKQFCELRPGLIGWLVINLGLALKQYKNRALLTGGSGSISLSMLLVTGLQGFYVWDGLYQEKAILTTMDITTDGFGYMLCFGDLSWVPFIYTLQARYLVDHDPNLSVLSIAVIVGIQALGYFIFRSANSQKDAFRKDPEADEVKHLTFLQTQRGTRLLTSGWWGAARKINYTGDWLITFSWCLLCGFNSPIPYFQAIYFAILLTHRAIRDDEMCHEKYGADWLEYKKRVPYMFIPGVV